MNRKCRHYYEKWFKSNNMSNNTIAMEYHYHDISVPNSVWCLRAYQYVYAGLQITLQFIR